MKKYLFLCAVLAGLTSCSASLMSMNYIGKTYPATNNPEIFMVWEDIPCAYEIMGRIDASPQAWKTLEDAQKAIEQAAREKGADAIVFSEVIRIAGDPTLTTTEEIKKDDNGDKTRTATSTQNTPVNTMLQATFIKYKK